MDCLQFCDFSIEIETNDYLKQYLYMDESRAANEAGNWRDIAQSIYH